MLLCVNSSLLKKRLLCDGSSAAFYGLFSIAIVEHSFTTNILASWRRHFRTLRYEVTVACDSDQSWIRRQLAVCCPNITLSV